MPLSVMFAAKQQQYIVSISYRRSMLLEHCKMCRLLCTRHTARQRYGNIDYRLFASNFDNDDNFDGLVGLHFCYNDYDYDYDYDYC
jgi:hypothetical protein